MQCKHYNCYDINEVLKKANLNPFCEQKSLSHYDQNYGRNYDQKQVLNYDRKQVQNGFFYDIKNYEMILKENQLAQPTQPPSCRKVLSVFPYALFLFYKRKTSIFENMKGKKVKSMEIKIRNLDKDIVLRIDELAKKRGLSRNEYLRGQIKQLALHPEITEKEDQYKRLVKEIAVVIQQNTQVLNELLLQEDQVIYRQSVVMLMIAIFYYGILIGNSVPN